MIQISVYMSAYCTFLTRVLSKFASRVDEDGYGDVIRLRPGSVGKVGVGIARAPTYGCDEAEGGVEGLHFRHRGCHLAEGQARDQLHCRRGAVLAPSTG